MVERSAIAAHKRIGIDTNIFIYLIEEKKKARLHTLLAEMERRRVVPICSTVLVTELLQQPFARGAHALIRRYQRILFTASPIEFISVTVPIATHAAQLAAAHKLKTPDALHLACAIAGGATAFLTADKGIRAGDALTVILV